MDVSHQRFELANQDGDPIRGDVRSPEAPEGTAAIVVCHGFKGFKDWGSFPYIGEQLAARTEYPTITFNFSGSGIGPDLQSFTELDRFRHNTFSKELDDLGIVLDAAAAGELPGLDARTRFGLLGHSRGGGTAILKAGEDERVACLVTWAATSSFDRWSEETRQRWRETGVHEVLNTRTGQMMPLGLELLEDVEKNPERLDILGRAAGLDVPLLVIHGSEDEGVPVSEGAAIGEAAPDELTRFVTIEGAGHTFGAVHPFEGTTEHLERAIGLSADWFAEHLS